MDVTGIGHACIDTIGLVPHLPALDEVLVMDATTRQGGGPVAQALVTLQRLGKKTAFHARLGDDAIAQEIRTGLEAEGVDCSHLLRDPGHVSNTSIILVDRATGKRSICAHRGDYHPIAPADLDLDALCAAPILHLDGHAPEAALHAAREARRRGRIVSIDAGHARDDLIPLAAAATLLIASEKFAMFATGTGDETAWGPTLRAMGPSTVVVTRGERGSLTWTADDHFVTPAFPVDVVDTTGAGDVFHGGYLYAVLEGRSPRECATIASAVAAMKCRSLGGRAGIPMLPALSRFLGDHGFTLERPPCGDFCGDE